MKFIQYPMRSIGVMCVLLIGTTAGVSGQVFNYEPYDDRICSGILKGPSNCISA